MPNTYRSWVHNAAKHPRGVTVAAIMAMFNNSREAAIGLANDLKYRDNIHLTFIAESDTFYVGEDA